MSNKIKLLVGIIIGFFIIIFSIMTSLSILKEEAEDNYLTISKLNAKSFSKELNQDIANIEQTIVNIQSILENQPNTNTINQRLNKILESYPQIRSINILENEKILYSSNKHNIGLFIQNQKFFPKPIFNDNILKVSTPWFGRDFFSGSDVYTFEDSINRDIQSFIPISKGITVKSRDFNVVINLNSDYFKDRFFSNITSDEIIFEIVRLDGVLLLSTKDNTKIGKQINTTDLLKAALDKSQYTTITNINNNKYIATYILTENYPISLAVKLDYEKSLSSWNKKQYYFFIMTTVIVVLSILITLIFFYLYNRKKEQELSFQKNQIQEQEKFKLLFQDSHFLAMVINTHGNIIELNNKALEFLGEDNKLISGKKFWDLDCWKKESRLSIKEKIENFDKINYQDELIIYNKKNEERIIDFTLSSIVKEDERLLVAIGIDITERIEKENKLKQSYAVFSNTRDGIVITDEFTRILDINIAFEKITGYNKSDILNKQTNILKSELHTNEFYKNMWLNINEKGFWEGEITNKNKNGENFIEWLTINTIYNENNEVENYIGIFSDITEQKAKEKLLKEKDNALYQQSKMAAMGEMIGNIAHQWRQPLSVISTAATGIVVQKSMGVSNEENEIKSLNAINDSAQYLSQTIEDFRDFLKVDKEVKLFNIAKTIKEALSLSSVNRKNKNINLVCNLDKEVEVYGVKNEFIQVMMNVLRNSEDALNNIDENKYIFIDTYIKDLLVIVKIKDSAGGISEKIISRIFEPYFTTKHQSQGTGIGLYMSQEIIKNHMKGKIYVKNESYEYLEHTIKGACFTIELPLK